MIREKIKRWFVRKIRAWLPIRKVGKKVIGWVKIVAKLPKWALLRLSSISGRSAGFWLVTLLAAIVGAIVAGVVGSLIYSAVFDSNRVVSVPSDQKDA